MRKKLLRLSLAFLVSVMPALPMLAQIPEGYYSSLKGKKGAELKTTPKYLSMVLATKVRGGDSMLLMLLMTAIA